MINTELSVFCKTAIVNYYSETVALRCSVKDVFLEISQNSQLNTCAGVSFSGSHFPVNFAKFLRTPVKNISGGCF